MIEVKLSDRAVAILKKRIEQSIVLTKYRLAEDILDAATVSNENPHWSNTFYQSWQITEGNSSGYYLKHPTNKRGEPNVKHESERRNKYPDPNYQTPYLSLHVRNTARHSGEVENVGTLHHQEPWKIAAHAKNNVLASFKR